MDKKTIHFIVSSIEEFLEQEAINNELINAMIEDIENLNERVKELEKPPF